MTTRILIAEADTRECDQLHHFLTDRDCQIETAGAGPECLRKIHSFQPDLMILNLELPWGGGEVILACMRDSKFDSIIPVVLTTSNPGLDRDRYLEPPVVKCLIKPINQETLLESIFVNGVPQLQL